MGEALISRAGGQEQDIEVLPNQAKILLTIMDSAGQKLSQIPVTANDSGSLYNYSTNSNGQCLFTLVSGWANFLISNKYSNGLLFADQLSNNWYNFETTLGEYRKINVQFTERLSGNISSNGNYTFLTKSIVNINIAGANGGAGGHCQVGLNSGAEGPASSGGTGGGGAIVTANNIEVQRNMVYKAIIGDRGKMGNHGWYWTRTGSYSPRPTSGTSGGTTSFLGYSASGGGGGSAGLYQSDGANGYSYGPHYGEGYITFS